MLEDTIIVFTAQSEETVLKAGGSKSWVLNRAKAKQCRYVVLCQNAYSDWGDGKELHGTAFMIGRIADVVPSPDEEKRWLITFEDYARLNVPQVWKGWRNPVRYATLEELDLDLTGVKFQPMPSPAPVSPPATKPHATPVKTQAGLSIPEAKKALALTFGVEPEDIEIVIRG